MSLARWLESGWLEGIPPAREEVARHLEVANRNLTDAAVPGLSTDTRVSLAHGAVLAAAAAALAAEGYRVGRERHHERLLDSLQYTISIDSAILSHLHRVRRARNAVTYERLGTTSEEEATPIVELAAAVRDAVVAWLGRHYPDPT